MSLASTAARGTSTTLLGQGLRFGTQTFTTLILSRILSPEDFGLFAIVVAIIGFGSLLADFGFSQASIQAKEVSESEQSNLFWINLAAGTISYGLLLLAAHPLGTFYHSPRLAPLIAVSGVSFIIQAISAQHIARLTRALKFGGLAVADIVSQIVGGMGAITLGLLGAGVWTLVAQQLLIVISQLIIVLSIGKWWPSRPSRIPMKRFMIFGLNTFGVQAMNYLTSNIDSLILGRTAGKTELGYYDRAYMAFKLPIQQVASPLTRVALPILSMNQENPSELERYLVRAQMAICYIVGSGFILSTALAQPLIAVVLGVTWLPSAPIFAILAIGGVFQCLGFVYYWTFLSTGLTGLQFRYSLITRVAMVALILIGVAWGIIGVAIAGTVGLFLNWLVLTLFPMRKTGVNVRLLTQSGMRPLLLHLSVALFLAVVDRVLLIRFSYVIRLGFGIFEAVGLYSLSALLIPAIRRDIAVIVRMVRLMGKGRSASN